MKPTCKIDDCDRPVNGLGLCFKHYQRYRNTLPLPDPHTLRDKFEERVNRDGPNGCWLWTGSIKDDGYGRLGGRKIRAHRLAYEIYIGPVPAGLVLDHLCRVRHCVNPDHLEAVPQEENFRRGQMGTRKTHCARGHELAGRNLILTRGGRGRKCRACQEITTRRRREIQQLEAAS